MSSLSPSEVVATFEKNRRSVRDLVAFDTILMDLVVESFRTLNGKWRKHLEKDHQLSGAALDGHPLVGANQLRTFENIRQNESLQPSFKAIHNLALVALVSFFESAARDLFRAVVAETFERNKAALKAIELKLTVGELVDGDDMPMLIAHAIEDTEKLSFQDMKSIGRAFRLLLSCDIPRDECVNDIIVAQACRHALVHAEGLVSCKFVHQIRDAGSRTIKPHLRLNESIEFSPAEIESVGTEMAKYLTSVASAERKAV